MADAAEKAEPGERPDRKVDLPDHKTRLGWYEEWEDQQRDNRKEARLDRDYYDGKQWSDDELKVLRQRGQPATVNNLLAKKLNTLLGEEIEKRFKPAARPRTPAHVDDARIATDALRYVADEQDFDQIRSLVAESCWKEGIGAALKVFDGDKHELKHVEYDRFAYDIRSRGFLFRDALWLANHLWIDWDEALEMFPGAEDMLEQAVSSRGESTEDVPRDWIDTNQGRKRVMVVEMYFRQGEDWHVSFFTKVGDLREPEPTAYLDENREHTICPLIAVSCYINGDGDRYGVLRNLRSLQDAVNKRESKSLHLLNSERTIVEQNVLPDVEAYKTELAKPDAVIEVAAGTLASPEGKRIEVQRNLDLAAGHVQLLQDAKASLDRNGPSASNLPELPASASGRAQQMRRKAAALDYGSIFDHLRHWAKAVFEIDWLCVREWTEEKWLRVTDDKELSGYRFVQLNGRTTRAQRFKELTEAKPPVPPEKALETAAGQAIASMVAWRAQQGVAQYMGMAKASGQEVDPAQVMSQAIMGDPLMQEAIDVHQVAHMECDIILDEAPDTATLLEEQFQTLTEMMGPVLQARPDMAPKMVRMLVQSSTLPDKRELLEAMDKGPDPKQQQQQQQVQQLQQQLAMTEAQLKAAQVAKTQAEARYTDARTQTEVAELGRPQQQPGPEPVSPLEQAKAQREMVNIDLDIERTRAEASRDHAAAASHAAKAEATMRQAMQPDVAVSEEP